MAMESLKSPTLWVCNITCGFCQAFEQEHGNLGETWGCSWGAVPNDLEKPIAAAPDTLEWCQKVIDIAPVYMSVWHVHM